MRFGIDSHSAERDGEGNSTYGRNLISALLAEGGADDFMLRNGQAKDVVAWSAAALGRLDARTAIPLFLKTAEDPDDFFLWLMSVESLVAWNATEAFPVFVRRLEDPILGIRLLALRGLERLGDPKAVDPISPYLSDPYPTMRAQVVTTLAALGRPKIRPQLEALAQKEMDPAVLQALEVTLPRLAN